MSKWYLASIQRSDIYKMGVVGKERWVVRAP